MKKRISGFKCVFCYGGRQQEKIPFNACREQKVVKRHFLFHPVLPETTKIISPWVSFKQCCFCFTVCLFWILHTYISIPVRLHLKVNSIPPQLNTIQAGGGFNFCWRALNRWPILEGPLCLPLSSREQIGSYTNEQSRDSCSDYLCPTLSDVLNTLSSCVFSDANHRRALRTSSQEELSKSKHGALPSLPFSCRIIF